MLAKLCHPFCRTWPVFGCIGSRLVFLQQYLNEFFEISKVSACESGPPAKSSASRRRCSADLAGRDGRSRGASGQLAQREVGRGEAGHSATRLAETSVLFSANHTSEGNCKRSLLSETHYWGKSKHLTNKLFSKRRT